MEKFNIKVETMVSIVLNNKDCYTGQGITTKTYKETHHATNADTSVDSARELNAFYVGNVQPSDLPEQSKQTLPESGNHDSIRGTEVAATASLLAGGLLIARRKSLLKTS